MKRMPPFSGHFPPLGTLARSSARPWLIALACLAPLLPQATLGAPEAEPKSDADQSIAAPATPKPAEAFRSTRPGRTGRDLGSRATPPPASEEVMQPVATPPPSPETAPEPQAATPAPQAPRPDAEALPQSEVFRLEQERRRKEMERAQHEAEEAEKARRAARMQEIEHQQQEAVRKEEEQRRKLLEQLPAPPN